MEQVRLQSGGESRPVYWIVVEEDICGQSEGEDEDWWLGSLEGMKQMAAEDWVIVWE